MRVLLKIILFTATWANAQSLDTLKTDSLKSPKFQMHIVADWYYAYNSSAPKTDVIPLYVSMNQNNQVNNNLSYIDLKYETKRFKAHFIPAIGSFMTANSAIEKGVFKNVLEANVAVKLSKKKEFWLEGGVLGSPYTNENPYSQEHLTYTRSLAAEYVPYYQAGFKFTYKHNQKLKGSLYLLNGWQQIYDLNTNKSLGTQIEYKPNSKDVFNWNTYIGSERSLQNPNYRTRYFTDIFWTHNFEGAFSFATCAFYGLQEVAGLDGTLDVRPWGQVNFSARYSIKRWGSFSGRVEYFKDNQNTLIQGLNQNLGFNCLGASVGYNKYLIPVLLVRAECKTLHSINGDIFPSLSSNFGDNMVLFTVGLTAIF
jgi:hypothetical protein